MTRNTKSLTVTLPLDMVKQVEEAAEQAGVSRSAFLQQAVERAVRNHRWQEIKKYGREQAQRMGIKPEDVQRLIEEYRAEMAAEEAEGKTSAISA